MLWVLNIGADPRSRSNLQISRELEEIQELHVLEKSEAQT